MCACCVLTALALLYLLVDPCDLHLEALREAQLVLQLDIRDRLLIKYTGGEEEGVVVSRGSGVSGVSEWCECCRLLPAHRCSERRRRGAVMWAHRRP